MLRIDRNGNNIVGMQPPPIHPRKSHQEPYRAQSKPSRKRQDLLQASLYANVDQPKPTTQQQQAYQSHLLSKFVGKPQVPSGA